LNGDHKLVYCLTGDGELQEGQNWEALMFGAHHKIDNIIMVIDYNLKQIDGPTDMLFRLVIFRQNSKFQLADNRDEW